MTLAYVGLGANLGDPQRTVSQAMLELAQLPKSAVAGRSPLYRSAPIGFKAQPDFINAVVSLKTELAAEALLDELLGIELRHGRKRSLPNAPRTLDLDLLLYGDRELSTRRLAIPHPRMHERAFVLKPLLDLDPGASVPGRGPVRALLAACKDQPVERIA
ncbi:MAG TPA: 2-amino-4-hydroxy-6-hydroxymethyldihydropteridine diphosphokinase [Burkholderiales bacterium]|nr:2-amino-4-hydroxy-6-hydroxymethyldihydropteridine diphosphokinase [Burkholderiales bacterium]